MRKQGSGKLEALIRAEAFKDAMPRIKAVIEKSNKSEE